MQARFTEALMHNTAKVPIPSEDIFSTTVSGQPKSEILVDLQRQHPDMKYHFVEDKLGTLEKVREACKAVIDIMICLAEISMHMGPLEGKAQDVG